jgi:hypothetical protein
MLEIDYALVPMSDVDHEMVRKEVAQRVELGQIPPPDHKVDGRVVVLNPDPVQTVHQISDDLRPRLRRIMMPAQEGSTHLSAERIYRAIAESDERLYLIIIELQSEFRSLSSFLDYLPRLRQDFPELAVFLSGSLHNLREKFHQVLAAGDATLVLDFPGERGAVEIASAEAFVERITTQEQVVSYATPFFTEIRLNLDKSGRPIPFNLLSLRKLHPVLGHGEAQEVEVGKGRKERMLIVDLPVSIVQDLRFRQDRGLDFLGVVVQGETIHSRHFGDEKLEFRWVPLRSLEKFLRRSPGGEQEEIDMAGVSALRVNTLTGQVSFVMKELEGRVALDQARSMSFRKKPGPKAAKELPPPEGGDGTHLVTFDRLIPPDAHSTHLNPMQEAVKAHFYHKLIGEEVEHARKVEVYAQRLNVAAVGPLAGQTVKLLRRFGLERLIDPDSFHYLCDTPEEIPTFQGTSGRYEEHFGGLVQLMREIAFGKPTQNIRLADIAYNLPISTEWVDTGLATLEKVSNSELEAVYHEMQLLADFIAHEFRRNFDLETGDVDFFEKIRNCREAGLLAKWLSEFKREAYGKPMNEGEHPDVLFFATDEDKKENDGRYFFPSLSCMELFREPLARGLFAQFDYDFSVFLEEQLALAIHQAREEGVMQPGGNEFEAYFQRRVGEERKELDDLRAALEAIDDSNSPLYHDMLEQEEEAYKKRFAEFQGDQQKVENQLAEANRNFAALLEALKPVLERGGMAEGDFYREQPEAPEALEQRLQEAAERTLEVSREHLEQRFAALAARIEDWRGLLGQFAEVLRRVLQMNQRWHTAEEQRQVAGYQAQWRPRLAARQQSLQAMKAMERDHHTRRVEAQLRNYQGELEQLERRVVELTQRNQRATATLASYVESSGARLEAMRRTPAHVQPEKVVGQAEALRKTLTDVSRNAETFAGRSQELQQHLEKIRLRRQRHLAQYYQLQVEMAVLKAIETHDEPVLPPNPHGTGAAPGEAEVARFKQEWEAQQAELAGFKERLAGGQEQVEEAQQALKGQAVAYLRFGKRREELLKRISRRGRLRESARGLAERRVLMEEEMADLPQRVKQLFMPARKKLLIDVFIPEAERRIAHFGKAQAFITELLGLSYEKLKQKYLEHAIYRRFYARQFLRGGAYAADPASPLHYAMRNVYPALKLLLKALAHNYTRHRIRGAERLTLPQIAYQQPRKILAQLESMAKSNAPQQFDYLVLPPTMPLMEGLNLMHRKDLLFNGAPRLVLFFITKFDGNLLKRDPVVRDAYFRALKHNIVVNIDGHRVVDNPRSIGMWLLQETLGCAIDVPDVEEPLEVVATAVD